MRPFLKTMLAASAVMFALAATPAAAQALPTHTWVSRGGDNGNACSHAAPCRTWAGALVKTAAGGEITAFDPGDYGRVVINKSITLSGGEGVGVFPPAGTSGIQIQAAAADRVVLRGLDIDGAGTGGVGVDINSAFDVLIADCTIHGFSIFNNSAGVNVLVTDPVRVTIRNSTLHSNNFGVNVIYGGYAAHVKVIDSLVLDNFTGGLKVDGAGNDIEIGNNRIFGVAGLIQTNGGIVRSYGGNVIPSATTPAQTAATK